MLTRHTKHKFTWIEITNPTEDEITSVKEEFLLPFDIATDLITPTLRPGAKIYDKCMYIVQHFPETRQLKIKNRKHEMDFVMADNWIISVTYSDLTEIINLKQIFEDTTDEKYYHSTNVGRFYIQIIKEIYKKCDQKIDELDESLESVEKSIYNGHERKMVGVLSQKMRDIIDLEHSFSMHENIILDTANYGQKVYGDNFTRGMNNLHSTFTEINTRLEFLKEAFREFQNTNDSLLQHQTAEAMKTLTMMSFVIFPLSLIAGVFGMNVTNMPIVGSEHDFVIIILIMFLVSVLFFSYFKWKKWL